MGMGIEKERGVVYFQRGLRHKVQTIAAGTGGGSTATAITNHGVTNITITSSTALTAAALVYKLDSPRPGMEKIIVVDNNSTRTVQIRTYTSAQTFFGSTKNSLNYSTVISDPPLPVRLIGLTTSKWAVISGLGTTGAVTVAGATA